MRYAIALCMHGLFEFFLKCWNQELPNVTTMSGRPNDCFTFRSGGMKLDAIETRKRVYFYRKVTTDVCGPECVLNCNHFMYEKISFWKEKKEQKNKTNEQTKQIHSLSEEYSQTICKNILLFHIFWSALLIPSENKLVSIISFVVSIRAMWLNQYKWSTPLYEFHQVMVICYTDVMDLASQTRMIFQKKKKQNTMQNCPKPSTFPFELTAFLRCCLPLERSNVITL